MMLLILFSLYKIVRSISIKYLLNLHLFVHLYLYKLCKTYEKADRVLSAFFI